MTYSKVLMQAVGKGISLSQSPKVSKSGNIMLKASSGQWYEIKRAGKGYQLSRSSKNELL